MEVELSDICTRFNNEFCKSAPRRDPMPGKGHAARGGSIPRHAEHSQADIFEKLYNMKKTMGKFKSSLQQRENAIASLAGSATEERQHEFLRPRIMGTGTEDSTNAKPVLYKRIQDLQAQNNELTLELRAVNKKLLDAKFENEYAPKREEDKAWKTTEGFHVAPERTRGYSQSRDDPRQLAAKVSVLSKELDKTRQVHEARILELKAEYKKKLNAYLSKLSAANSCIGQFLLAMQSLQMGVVRQDKNIESLRNEFEHQKGQLASLSKELRIFEDPEKKELRHVNLSKNKLESERPQETLKQGRGEGPLSELTIRRRIPRPPSMSELGKEAEAQQRAMHRYKESEAALKKQVKELRDALSKTSERRHSHRSESKETVKKKVEKAFRSIERVLLTKLAKLDYKATIEAENLASLKALVEERKQEKKSTARFQRDEGNRAELEERAEELRQSVESAETENKELRLKIDKMQDIINKYKESTRNVVTQKDSTIKRYKVKIEQLTKAIEDTKSRTNIQSLKSDLVTMFEAHSTLSLTKINELNLKLSKAVISFNKFVKTHKLKGNGRSRECVEKVASGVRELGRAFGDGVKRAVEKYTKKSSLLEAMVLILQERLADLSEKEAESEEIIAKLTDELKKNNGALINSKRVVASTIEKVNLLKKDIVNRLIRSFNSRFFTLQHRVCELGEKYKAAKLEGERMASSLCETDQLVQELATRPNDDLRDELDEKEEVIRQMKELTADLSNQIAAIQGENTKLVSDNKALLSQLNEANKISESFKDQFATESELKAKHEEDLMAELNALINEQSALVAQNELLLEEAKSKDKELEAMKVSVKKILAGAARGVEDKLKASEEDIREAADISSLKLSIISNKLEELSHNQNLLKLKLEEKSEQCKNTEEELELSKALAEELEQRIKDNETIVEEQLKELQSNSDIISILQEEVERKSKKLDELRAENRELEEEFKKDSTAGAERVKEIQKLKKNLRDQEAILTSYKGAIKTSIIGTVQKVKHEIAELKDQLNISNNYWISFIESALGNVVSKHRARGEKIKNLMNTYLASINQKMVSHSKEAKDKIKTIVSNSMKVALKLANEVRRQKEIQQEHLEESECIRALEQKNDMQLRKFSSAIQLLQISHSELHEVLADKLLAHSSHIKVLQNKVCTIATMRSNEKKRYNEEVKKLLGKLEEEKESNRALIASTKDSSLAEIHRLREQLATATQDANDKDELLKECKYRYNAKFVSLLGDLNKAKEEFSGAALEVKIIQDEAQKAFEHYKQRLQERIEMQWSSYAVKQSEEKAKLEKEVNERQELIESLSNRVEDLQNEVEDVKANLEEEKVVHSELMQQLSDKLLKQQEEVELASKANELSLNAEEQRKAEHESLKAAHARTLHIQKQAFTKLKEAIISNIKLQVDKYEGKIELLDEQVEKLTAVVDNMKHIMNAKLKAIMEGVVQKVSKNIKDCFSEIVSHINSNDTVAAKISMDIQKLLNKDDFAGAKVKELGDLEAKNIKLTEELKESQELSMLLNTKLMKLQVDRTGNEDAKSMPGRLPRAERAEQSPTKPGAKKVLYRNPSSASLQGSDSAAGSNLSVNTCPLPTAPIDKSLSAEMETKIAEHVKKLIVQCLQSVPLNLVRKFDSLVPPLCSIIGMSQKEEKELYMIRKGLMPEAQKKKKGFLGLFQ